MNRVLYCLLARRLRFSRQLRQWHLHRKQHTSSWSGSFSTSLISLLERRQSGNQAEAEGLGCKPDTTELAHVASMRAAILEAITALGEGGEGEKRMANVAPESVANAFRTCYWDLKDDAEKKKAFLSVLAGDLSVDHDQVAESARHLLDQHSSCRTEATLFQSEGSVRQALTPFYSDLFTTIARLDKGIKFLVDLRGDLLRVIKESQGANYLLSEMSSHLREILAQWFTPQLLKVRQVTWESPCDILEKVSQYEAVYPLRHWRDLKHRLGANRRCFIFTHKAIPREPLVILHAALTSQPSSSIQALLDRSLYEDPKDACTAVFYSISSTQKGLSGVHLGDFLIRNVVKKLQQEWQGQLKTFVTLSPIPGFRKWLLSHLQQGDSEACRVTREELNDLLQLFPRHSNHLEALQDVLNNYPWTSLLHGELAQALRQPMTSLCTRYLALEKRRGHALDSVANFHLANGASIFRVNWLGDTSPNGFRRSFGFMVNYQYEMSCVAQTSDAYRASGKLLSDQVQKLL